MQANNAATAKAPSQAKRLPISKTAAATTDDRDFNYPGVFCAFWAIKADSLIRAFDILVEAATQDLQGPFDKPEISAVPHMMAGLALENIFKGVFIMNGGKAVENGEFKHSGHNLRWLSEKAGVTLSPEEHILFERLQEFVEWGSKYPLPRHAEKLRARDFPDGSKCRLTDGFIFKDYKEMREALTKFRQLLPPVVHNAPDPTVPLTPRQHAP